MTIKLIRTDALDSTKIPLQRGEHIIGRGKLLDCNDKRISREHGELLVKEDSITIKALHQNPCFYMKKDSKETEILRLGNSIILNNGDKFGLLPDTYWYEVLYCLEEDSEANETDKYTEEYPVEEADTDSNALDSDKANDDSRIINFNHDETVNKEGPESPSLISNHDETNRPQNEPHDPKPAVIEPILPQQEDNEPEVNEPTSSNAAQSESNEPEHEPEDGSNKSIKRSHSPDGNDVKKTKTEDVKVKPDPDGVKPDPDGAKPGPSDQAAAANANNGGPSNNKPNLPRERCMYGANCYRKNPQHRSQFSHPCDADWGPGERGICPYGINCGKRDPRHWRDHEHPPGLLPPPGPGQEKRKKQVVLPGLNIVTGKRVRKTVQRQDWNDSGSDQDIDPYGTDESDEWEPDSNDYSEDYV